MARAHITAAPIAAPCTARQPISNSIDGASTPPMAASTYPARPHSSTGRRPKRSDSGPSTSCEQPKASSSAVNVSCACATGAPKPIVSAGSAGR